MGSKNKLKRFKENETFSNVIQPERSTLLAEEFAFRGNWRDTHFKNQALSLHLLQVGLVGIFYHLL